MTSIVIQIATPIMTMERFSELSGIPLKTVKDKASNPKAELPTIKTNLLPNRNGAKYINMVKLAEMAAADSFVHPMLNTSTRNLNQG